MEGERPQLQVRNDTSATKTVGVGCRTDQTTVFEETRKIAAGDTETYPELPLGHFEVGVTIPGSDFQLESFHSDEVVDRLSVEIGSSGITFVTDSTAEVSVFDDQATEESATAGRGASPEGEAVAGANQVYCRTCGSVISQHDERCSNCGAPNPVYEPEPVGSDRVEKGQATPAGSTGGSSEGETSGGSPPTNVGRFGIYLALAGLGVVVAASFLTLLLTFGGGLPLGASVFLEVLLMQGILVPLRILTLIVLPVALYLDLRYIGFRVDSWPLRGHLYIAAAVLVPLLGLASQFVAFGPALVTRAVTFIGTVSLLWLCIRHLGARSRVLG